MADSTPLISSSSKEEEGTRRGRKKICGETQQELYSIHRSSLFFGKDSFSVFTLLINGTLYHNNINPTDMNILSTLSLGCTTLKDEFKGAYFDLVEQQGSEDGSDARALDVASTFSPKPHALYIVAKLIIVAWIISVMVMRIMMFAFPSFWLAFLTHWTLVLTVAYSLMSFVASVVLACRPPQTATLTIWLKVMWALYAAMLPANVLVTILYWALEFDGTTNYPGVMVHGGTMVLIMIDGCILSRIPIRIKQFWFYELFCFLYIVWTIIHSFTLGNPFREARGEDDNSIYGALGWKNNTTTAIITSVLVLFVGNPIIFLLCRLLSRCLPRRYEDNAPKSLNEYVDERV